jgi:hypothetical protein
VCVPPSAPNASLRSGLWYALLYELRVCDSRGHGCERCDAPGAKLLSACRRGGLHDATPCALHEPGVPMDVAANGFCEYLFAPALACAPMFGRAAAR